ncbi:hypothetical protein halTADL_2507 [Halohasta litchfieldiae]|jgi:hypothetical protein|uniref:Uncharacterized protein n=1 Tax=Halohasta litchfieldiae TaxID=1073996 RepID=A0A1H6S336_9EURY|nr:hypothetical protein [Halohasta litchfieldiae]ATW89239.1 hypothetical protein halTADL_2507 [Halohasta litchfieldiae]SEI57852.1 hypothetical protein SAMN05444271_10328 [Halohasta litchfieldiae]
MWVVALSIVFVGLGLAVGWFGLRPLTVVVPLVRNEVQDPSAVSESDGFVVCRGTATENGESFAAPFTGRDCLGFEFEVTERQLAWIGLPWSNNHLDDGVATTPFALDGAYGTVAVDPSSRRFSLDTESAVISVDSHETPADRIQRFLDVREIQPVARWLAAIPLFGTRRFIERRVDPGEEYVIAGRVEHRQGTMAFTGDLVITDQSPRQLAVTRLWSSMFPLLIAAVFVGSGLWAVVAL